MAPTSKLNLITRLRLAETSDERRGIIAGLTDGEIEQHLPELRAYQEERREQRNRLTGDIEALADRMLDYAGRAGNGEREDLTRLDFRFIPEYMRINPNSLGDSTDEEQFLVLVCDAYSLKKAQLRDSKLARRRSTAGGRSARLAYRESVFTLAERYARGASEIGRLVRRDHSTVIHTYRDFCREAGVEEQAFLGPAPNVSKHAG